jgi:hypothetical protein
MSSDVITREGVRQRLGELQWRLEQVPWESHALAAADAAAIKRFLAGIASYLDGLLLAEMDRLGRGPDDHSVLGTTHPAEGDAERMPPSRERVRQRYPKLATIPLAVADAAAVLVHEAARQYVTARTYRMEFGADLEPLLLAYLGAAKRVASATGRDAQTAFPR